MTEGQKPRLSVLIPTYNNADTIVETIKSILSQSFEDFELIIRDDVSTDNTVELINSFNDDRIKFLLNEKNLGCGENLNACLDVASADIVVYVCADDILDVDALKKINEAFLMSSEIGIVIRPYYWFEENFKKPVRITKQFNKTEIVSINSAFEKIKDVISLSDQLSGVGFRKKYIIGRFQTAPFVETASMVAAMLKSSNSVILKDNIVAVRISHSGSRSRAVYKKSPMLSWYDLINEIFAEEKFAALRKYLIKNFIAINYIGLIQIKIYGGYAFLFREIFYLLKFRWQNIFSFGFWFCSLGTIIIPGFILKILVAVYKNAVNSKFLRVKSINNNF